MPEDRWGPDGPPPEAYSRVTDPERFAPLHDEALRILEDLARRYEVLVDQDAALRTHVGTDLARPTVRLTPRAEDAAPLTIAFTPFPGLIVEAGRWFDAPIPVCGCDACDEKVETCIDELRELVAAVTSGWFSEEIANGIGGPMMHATFSHPDDPTRKRRRGTSAKEQPRRTEPRRYDWAAWPVRGGG